MRRYYFVIFVITAFMMISSVNVADASLPYEKQVKFVSAIEEVYGHILAARENIVNGNQELASLHLIHPIAELYDDFHTVLKNNVHTDKKIEFSLFILKNIDTMNVDFFDKQVDGIYKILDDAKIELISEDTLNDSTFKLDVIVDILEMSKIEYGATLEIIDESFVAVEFQDAHAFVVRAKVVLDTIDDMELVQKNNLELNLQQFQSSILNKESLKDIETRFDHIVDEIRIIKQKGLGFEPDDRINGNKFEVIVEESPLPSWIKLNAAWWADDLVSDVEFLSGIKYLIEEKIIVVSQNYPHDDEINSEIPSWIKHRTGWWADGLLSDKEFLSGIEYLIEKGILQVNR